MKKKSKIKLLILISIVLLLSLIIVSLIFLTILKNKENIIKNPAGERLFKVGIIYIGNETQGYTRAHMDGIVKMKENLDLSDEQVIERKDVEAIDICYETAVDLAQQGCKLIFATSLKHEGYVILAALEFPEVEFCHASGYKASMSGLTNFSNFMPAIYQARYVSGVAAGLKLNQMIDDNIISAADCKVGYVGAYPYAEIISGYTAFYLGIKSVCPAAYMVVRYTNSWADLELERKTANNLIDEDCILLSHHTDTDGVAIACEARNIPCVGYNSDMIQDAPNTIITSAAFNWGVYYTFAANTVMQGKELPLKWSKGYSENAVFLTPLNEKVAAKGTQEKIDSVIELIKTDQLHIFDTSTFTIQGSKLEELISDDENYAIYANYIKDGYFQEQELTSSPAFNIRIDGITELIPK